MALCGAARVDQPLELQTRDHVLELSPAVFPICRVVPERESRSHNNGAKVLLDHLVLLSIVYGPHIADFFTELALASLKVNAIVSVDDRDPGHGLRKRDVDGLARAQVFIEL